jgi:hypothetical protein
VNVVPNAGREHRQATHRDHQLAADHLNVVVDGVVLEDHRQARVVSEEFSPKSGIFRSASPNPHRKGGLGANPDIQVARAIRGIHRNERCQKSIAELLAHRLSAHDSVHAVAPPIQTLAGAELE